MEWSAVPLETLLHSTLFHFVAYYQLDLEVKQCEFW